MTRRNKTRLLLLAALPLLLLGGCAPKRIALDPGAAGEIQSIYVEHVIEQESLALRHKIQTGGREWFGLIGALVDAGVNSGREDEAETLALVLQPTVEEMDLPAEIWNCFEATLNDAAWPAAVRFSRERGAVKKSSGNLAKHTAGIAEEAYLHLDSELFLAPGGACLGLETNATLYPSGDGKAIYHSWYAFYSDPIGAGVAGDGYSMLAKDDGALFKALLADALEASRQMIERDLLRNDRFPSSNPKGEAKYLFKGMGTVQPYSFKGTVVDSDDDYHLIRSEQGFLYTIGKGLAGLATARSGWEGAN